MDNKPNAPQNDHSALCTIHSALATLRVAVCGELPTACNFLLENGVVQIDQYSDATEISDESRYHLLLIHAPCAEGLLNTHYSRSGLFDEGERIIPIRLLGEPCCRSALVELKSTLRRISKVLKEEAGTIITT